MRIVRRFCLTLTLAALALTAACSPAAPEPTATAAVTEAIEATAEFTPEAPFSQISTLAAENAVLITPAAPGTVVYQDTTQTPNFTPSPFSFDVVTFTREGGLDGEMLIIRLYSDGRLEINDTPAETRVSAAQVEAIRTQLEALDLFRLGGSFTAPNARPDTVYYNIGLATSEGAITVPAQEGFVPPEMQQVFDALLALVPPA
ncbi:MAG: hypothetical protein SF162_18615 [bacterium]|nr:hypothetical protein [bacterium]